MRYSAQHTSQISFPLGGIGSGCIGLSGNGHLIDWEIFNRSGKGRYNGFSHFAVRAEKDGKVVDFRLLHGDEPAPYTGPFIPGSFVGCSGFGWGTLDRLLCGWPHFRKHTFRGEYPFAAISFSGESAFPGKVFLSAWSPLIPGNSKDSSIPCAVFSLEIKNNTDTAYDYTGIGVLGNPWCAEQHKNRVEGNILTVSGGEDEFSRGDLSLTVLEDIPAISFQEYWYHGKWWDDREMYYNDIMRGGPFKNRHYDEESPCAEDTGLLASHFRLNPGESRKVVFLLTWNIPLRRNDWNKDADKEAAAAKIENRWKNYYATVWQDSRDSARYLEKNFTRIHKETERFHKSLFSSKLPKSVLDGISANISILKSPTCLRLEDGTFWGWEGVGPYWGSCQGSCTHVWNYEQTTAFLFPDLARSMLESHLKYSVAKNGACRFRVPLPLGLPVQGDAYRSCADGQFGIIMRFFRDWKITGDTAYLRRWWPTLKKIIAYTWASDNQDRWDPEQTGVLTGRQHHTLDMELFGPNTWLTGHYLGALQAARKMANQLQDTEFEKICRTILERGKKRVEETLFNGEYYQQQIDLKDKALVESFQATDSYWNEEAGEIKYQLGSGCGIDAVLAEYYAALYGIGPIFDSARVDSTLRAIMKYNFTPEMRRICNTWRSFSVNDESGICICTWPRGGKPSIPLPYSTETMHGFEWSLAGHLAVRGMWSDAVKIAESIRARYDGIRRNPWNEIECGSNYARSMAAYGLLPAFSGFRFDSTQKSMGFLPKGNELNVFWSLGRCWGRFKCTKTQAVLTVDYGSLELKTLCLPDGEHKVNDIIKEGSTVKFSIAGKSE